MKQVEKSGSRFAPLRMYGKLEARRLGSLQRKAERPGMTKDRKQRDEKRSKVGEGEGKLYLKSESGAARW